MRLDLYLIENGFFKTRSRAQNEIKSGHVLVNKKIEKSSYDVKENDSIEIVNPIPYVSRGGLKLEKAIKVFNLDFKDKVVLDIGASTGGFTDCALKNGAKLVYAVDVGSNQLNSSLRNDRRVISYEQTNILDTDIKDNIDYLVMDVSFVSILHLVSAIKKYLNDSNKLVCLIKPEFEAGSMNKKGVIKAPNIHETIVNNVINALALQGLYVNALDYSPIKGGSGNIEFISIIETTRKGRVDVKKVVKESHKLEG
ncbi:MAG: TlyA family RNA methyltransferase [Acholeplasmatales bacterium]|nr:TlyA family RNA methyltransferase [Acholeplasmatales bacterium]